MNSVRRMYFKKQIMKNLSQQENAIKEGTSTENSFTVIDNPYSERVPLMTMPINKEDTNTIEEKPQNAEKGYDCNKLQSAFPDEIADNQTDLPFKISAGNNQNTYCEQENFAVIEDISVTVLGSSSYHNQNKRDLLINTITFNEENAGNINNIGIEPQNAEESESGELHPTFTEIIADKEMDLIRKSLEEDDIDNDKSININITDNKQVQENKKSKRCELKKSYVDFLSDEEDFVWDSTSWKETGDESSEIDEPEKKKKKNSSENGKVGDSGLRKKKINKRKVVTDARDKGREYIRKNGCIVNARCLQPNPCLGKACGNNCQEVSEAKRKNIFDHFWGLTPQRKKDWLIAMTSRNDVIRKRSKDSNYRENTYQYFINDGEGRRKICKKFLMCTLDITQKYISYTLTNATFGLSKQEARGKLVPKNKTSEEIKNSVINFIKGLPALPSHYCRKDTTRLYLPTEFRNIKNLYRIYKEARTSEGVDVVGEQIFRNIFTKNFNIGFHVPKKDKCVKCLRFEGKDTSENPDNNMMMHLKEKEASKRRLAFHRELCKKNKSILCTSFDLQKVLNTPHGQSMLLFYSRKYTVYNLCFYESVTRNGFCYVWGETEGKRGGNEIASILQKYIADVDSRGSFKSLVLYSDSCPGQNKNKLVLAAIHNALLQANNIETIQMNYLLPGHTEMTVDSIHATIENSVRNTIIWAPSQWVTVCQLARKDPRPYEVEALNHKDFKNFEEFSDKYFKGNLSGKISKIRVATFKKSSPNVMTVKYSMIEDTEDEIVGIISRPKQLHQKYKSVLPITTTKHNDLKKLCDTGVIPTLFHSEYASFSHRNGKDVLVDTDIEDDEETSPLISDSI